MDIDTSREAVERLAERLNYDGLQLSAATLRALRSELDAAERERDAWKLQSDDWQKRGWELGKQADAADATGYARGAKDAAAAAHEAWKNGCPPAEISEAILALLPKETTP